MLALIPFASGCRDAVAPFAIDTYVEPPQTPFELDVYGAHDEPMVDVALNSLMGCGVRAGGTIECWGDWTPEPLIGADWVEIDGNHEVMCALSSKGEVGCIGTHGTFEREVPEQSRGLSVGPFQSQWAVVSPDGTTRYDGVDVTHETMVADRVSMGLGHMCAWQLGGRIDCSPIRGDDFGVFPDHLRVLDGDLWPGLCAVRSDGALQCFDPLHAEFQISETPPLGRFERVWTSATHRCAATEDGELVCWGPEGLAVSPTQRGWGEVDMENDRACAIAEDGDIRCWTLFAQ